jgi:hypothetical protein
VSTFDDVDVTAAGLAVGIGAHTVAGAHLSASQCAAVVAINERLQQAELLISVAANTLLSDNWQQRYYVMQQLRDFELAAQ